MITLIKVMIIIGIKEMIMTAMLVMISVNLQRKNPFID